MLHLYRRHSFLAEFRVEGFYEMRLVGGEFAGPERAPG